MSLGLVNPLKRAPLHRRTEPLSPYFSTLKGGRRNGEFSSSRSFRPSLPLSLSVIDRLVRPFRWPISFPKVKPTPDGLRGRVEYLFLFPPSFFLSLYFLLFSTSRREEVVRVFTFWKVRPLRSNRRAPTVVLIASTK